MKKLLLLLALLAAQQTFADDFGLAAGQDNGYGFSWRSWNGGQGFQVTGLPIINQSTVLLSLGGKLLQTIDDNPWTRFYVYVGVGAKTGSGGSLADAGAGFGMEFIAWDHLVFDLETGLGGGVQDGQLSAGLRVQGGVFYRL